MLTKCFLMVVPRLYTCHSQMKEAGCLVAGSPVCDATHAGPGPPRWALAGGHPGFRHNWPFPLSCSCLSRGSGDTGFLCIGFSSERIFLWAGGHLHNCLRPGPTLSCRRQEDKSERLFTSEVCFLHTLTTLCLPSGDNKKGTPQLNLSQLGSFLFLTDVF